MGESIKSKYKPSHPRKYKGNAENIICRSSWERKFCRYCDLNENILEWGSEEFYIPYVSPVDRKVHKYFPDFIISTTGPCLTVPPHSSSTTALWSTTVVGLELSMRTDAKVSVLRHNTSLLTVYSLSPCYRNVGSCTSVVDRFSWIFFMCSLKPPVRGRYREGCISIIQEMHFRLNALLGKMINSQAPGTVHKIGSLWKYQ